MRNTYFLYVKTHLKTGLKYLGKTEKNPYRYKGSGKYWKRHISKHGNDVWTNVIFISESKDEFIKTGLYYSKLWNIIESKEWANMRAESGDGNDSEAGRQIAERRVREGTHPFLGGEIPGRISRELLSKGIHPFQNKEKQRERSIKSNSKRLENGTHNFLDKHFHKRKSSHPNMPHNKSYTCPYCGKVGRGNMMQKWHFNNCKHKESL